MLYREFGPAELHPGLTAGEGVRLRAYCREHTGLLADDGKRWAVLILPGGAYRRLAPAESDLVALAFLAAGIQAAGPSLCWRRPQRWPSFARMRRSTAFVPTGWLYAVFRQADIWRDICRAVGRIRRSERRWA